MALKTHRQGNDFKLTLQVYRLNNAVSVTTDTIPEGAIPEDLTNAQNIKLSLYCSTGACTVLKKTVNVNTIVAEIPTNIQDIGTYFVLLEYDVVDISFADGLKRITVDFDAFKIVCKSAYADTEGDMSLIGVVKVGLDGKSAYQYAQEHGYLGTEEEFGQLQYDATLAAVNEAERIIAESDREQTFDTQMDAIDSAIGLADIATDNTNLAATNANDKATLANNAATNADSKAQLAETAASNADIATGLANTATTNANNAASNADAKATLANDAAINADTKAGLADQKATLANDAAILANASTVNANTATGNANNAALAANSLAGTYNVTVAIPLGAGLYYTSTTARAAVPTANRLIGRVITYATASGVWATEKFIGADVANWTVAGNWITMADLSSDQLFNGVNQFGRGTAHRKGLIAYGQDSLPLGVGRYVVAYVSPTYGSRLLSYDGVNYFDIGLGAMVGTTPSLTLKSNGDASFAKIPTAPTTDPTLDGQLTTKKYVDAKDVQLGADLNKRQTSYPFKNGINDIEILTLNNFIKYLYIKNRNSSLKYYLSSVLRNVIPDGDTIIRSIINFYSKSSGGTLVKIIDINIIGDEGSDGNLKRYTASDGSWDIIVDWSSILSGTKISGLALYNKIEISNDVFVKNNYDSEISSMQQSIINIQDSTLFKIEFTLTDGGYIDKRNGLVSLATGFSYTDFIKVKPGQIIHYKGYNYGNATICGYEEDKITYINLLESPPLDLAITSFTIPDNIYYIRACTAKYADQYIMEIHTDINYEIIDDEINNVIESNTKSSNIIQDPYFKYGIMLTSIDPKIISFGGEGIISLSNGEAISKSYITYAKGMQIMASFSQGWATKLGLKAGDKIRIGTYIKAIVGSNSTITGYGTLRRNDLPIDKITYTPLGTSLPLNSYSDWQWTERTIILKTDGTDIDQQTDLSLGWISLTDPGAGLTPTELHIKQPCILFDPSPLATGFYDSDRSKQIDYLFVNFLSIMNSLSIGGDLSVNNLFFNGSQVEGIFLNLETEKAKVRWIELSDNQCFPSNGNYIGMKNGTDLIFSNNGVETKLN